MHDEFYTQSVNSYISICIYYASTRQSQSLLCNLGKPFDMLFHQPAIVSFSHPVYMELFEAIVSVK